MIRLPAMPRLTAIPRLTVGLVTIAVGLLLLFDLLFRLFPSEIDAARQVRARVANVLAIQVAALVQTGDIRTLGRTLAAIKAQESEIESLAVRRSSGELVAQTAGHEQSWASRPGDADAISIGLMAQRQPWGTLEVAFHRLSVSPSQWLLSGPTRMLLLFTVLAGLLYFVYLRSVLQYLDPSAAVPDRVRGAFDALSEGVLIVDVHERVLLVNRSMLRLAGLEADSEVLGRPASSLAWLQAAEQGSDTSPWRTAMHSGEPLRGQPFHVQLPQRELAQVVLNCSPLRDERDAVRGCLVTVDDVTELQRSHRQLLDVLADLAASKQELELKNSELETLASRDPLSGCLNRRAFDARFAVLLAHAREHSRDLVCIMADIDRFKSINDRFGHPVGDEAIQRFAEVLRQCVRVDDLIGRYGGEEFCIVLLGVSPAQGLAIAETMRECLVAARGVGASAGHDVRMSASFGLAVLTPELTDEAELIAQADRALYLAKQGGRNRVERFAPPTRVAAEASTAP